MTTANATLTKIMHLHNTYNLAEDWGVTHKV